MENSNEFLYLFERPLEPLDDKIEYYEEHEENEDRQTLHLEERILRTSHEVHFPSDVPGFNRTMGMEGNPIYTSTEVTKIKVKRIQYPNIDDILELPSNAAFSLFNPEHQKLAARLIKILMDMPTREDFKSMATYARGKVNPVLFYYAVSVAILHRHDTQNEELQSLMLSFPDNFLDPQVLTECKQNARRTGENKKAVIEIKKDYTASEFDEEQRLAYFREDLGVNLHHWHWHLVYPVTALDEKVVNKDRRGELFYYMHQQIVARYNFERLCNQLKRVEKFSDWRQPIKEAYFPKLNNKVASRAYPGRVANQILSDVNRIRDKTTLDIAKMELWRTRIFNAIHRRYVIDKNNKEVKLDEFEGIDILGNIVEASMLSKNETYYGSLHNMGHNMISFIHDPDYRYLEDPGVMSDVSTAMRDPIFYRWHSFIDDIFQEHKKTLPPYDRRKLEYPGISICEIYTESLNAKNILNTFWKQSEIDIGSGLDFQVAKSSHVRFTHLQHNSFTYNICVWNDKESEKMGTCRLFLAPKFNERGNPWMFSEQRLMFIELDKFTVTLKPGENFLTRKSCESSVTIPFERTYRNLNIVQTADGVRPSGSSFCGCGWPQNLLIPKGTSSGVSCQLFVMISNYDDDKVDQDLEGACKDAGSYCGIKDKKYPDRRSMGYPFDRVSEADSLQNFLTPNMNFQEIKIKFNDVTIKPHDQEVAF